MRRIQYQGEEYLIHTRSGMRVADAMREMGIPVPEYTTTENVEAMKVKWPKDTAFLLFGPTDLEETLLGQELAQGYRLADEAIFK
jgi:hypothetical protein